MSTNPSACEITEIPFQKLLAWTGNVRTAGTGEGIRELAASITSMGLLHNLVVKKEARGKFSVIAGGRHLQAFSQLAEAGTIPRSFPVPLALGEFYYSRNGRQRRSGS